MFQKIMVVIGVYIALGGIHSVFGDSTLIFTDTPKTVKDYEERISNLEEKLEKSQQPEGPDTSAELPAAARSVGESVQGAVAEKQEISEASETLGNTPDAEDTISDDVLDETTDEVQQSPEEIREEIKAEQEAYDEYKDYLRDKAEINAISEQQKIRETYDPIVRERLDMFAQREGFVELPNDAKVYVFQKFQTKLAYGKQQLLKIEHPTLALENKIYTYALVEGILGEYIAEWK